MKPTIKITSLEGNRITIDISGDVEIIIPKKEEEFFTIPELPNLEIALYNLNKNVSWDTAMEKCPSGWRLPIQQELMIIWASLSPIERAKYNFCECQYWSSTEHIIRRNDVNAWSVYFSNGNTSSNDKANFNYVRYVRDKKL